MLHPAFATRQRSRWMRPDAPRWLRPDAAKFLKPGSDPADVYPALTRQCEVAQPSHERAIDVALAHQRSVLGGLRSELAVVKSDLAWRRLVDALARKYSPNQPRVPAGSTGGGQWTSGTSGRPRVVIDTTDLDHGGEFSDADFGVADNGQDWFADSSDINPGFDAPRESFLADDGSSPAFDNTPARALSPGITDTRIVSDADPDVVRPGDQYAQGRRVQGGGTIRINGRNVEITPREAARLDAVRLRAEDSIARVREIDPNWKPTPSAYQSAEGLIRAYEADAIQAQARIDGLRTMTVPGTFAGRSIPAPNRQLNSSEQRELNQIMSETGCHNCGTFSPSTRSGNAIGDHQPPSALNTKGRAQRLFPHCAACSSAQGGFVSGIMRRRR